MFCQFCDREYINRSGYSNHVRRCPKNPNRIHNTITESGREKIRQWTINNNEKQWSNPDNRQKQSERMKRAVRLYPESYTSSNRGRTKQIIIDGIKLQGQWEVDFYNWAKENNLNPLRPTESFKYEWNGERQYHPDFYIPSLDLYIEVKGYETDRDRAKWKDFPQNLALIKSPEITLIRKNLFTRDNLLNKKFIKGG